MQWSNSLCRQASRTNLGILLGVASRLYPFRHVIQRLTTSGLAVWLLLILSRRPRGASHPSLGT